MKREENGRIKRNRQVCEGACLVGGDDMVENVITLKDVTKD